MPAFLIHDSPREADLGLDLYHRLFLFTQWLEGVGNQPLFQYIITTTTPPPDEVKTETCLRLTLRGTPAKERLLSTRPVRQRINKRESKRLVTGKASLQWAPPPSSTHPSGPVRGRYESRSGNRRGGT